MLSFENLARDNVAFLYPSAFAKNGVKKLIRGAYQDYLHWDDYGKRNIWFQPDGYFHFWSPDDEGGTDQFILIEIEDTNKLTIEKLCSYGKLWDEMCCQLRLWTFNRYGKFTGEHNLSFWYSYPRNYSKTSLSLLDFDKPTFPDDKIYMKVFPGELWQAADTNRKKYLIKLEKERVKQLMDPQDEYGW